jgi:hypothetical protein
MTFQTARTDRLIRWTTTASVLVLAGIAAVTSYKHMYILVRRYGETSWTAALLPISVDGMIAASSMSLLAASRQGQRSGILPWALLVIGSAASLSANVAVAEPSAVGRLIAAWPSCALIGSYELLMRQIKQAAIRSVPEKVTASYEGHTSLTTDNRPSYTAHTSPTLESAISYEARITGLETSAGSYDAQTEGAAVLIRDAHGRPLRDAGQPQRADTRRRPSACGLQLEAWHWALANRTPAGKLPSGKAIAERFGRRERWGRLVKQAGLTGRLDPVTTLTQMGRLCTPPGDGNKP